ncbi:MAG: glutathione S-transferase family protein [Pseudomonadales bacterium]|nr:glutathione S-transferase family protein [Pseudomonadales bacterium]
MTTPYKLYGYELSPYSVKVRSYLRYKKIPHEWIVRTLEKMPEFQQHAKLPLVPLVVTPENESLQDSTPIIETLEKSFAENSITPNDKTLAFISYLIEEFGDEWGNKPMFHYRWRREVDQDSAAFRLAKEQLGEQAPEDALQNVKATVKSRMVDRVWFVGSSDETAPFIESNFKELLSLLEDHLQTRSYLLGNRPSFGDFGLYAQLYECYTDPTPGTLIKEQFPAVCNWIERMINPTAEGEFESWTTLSDTLFPLLKEQIAGCFLPWSQANAQALMANEETFSVTLKGFGFAQKPQKYHAKSLHTLRERYQSFATDTELNQILDASGCLEFLT